MFSAFYAEEPINTKVHNFHYKFSIQMILSLNTRLLYLHSNIKIKIYHNPNSFEGDH